MILNDFKPSKADEHFPELHVIYRKDDDCSVFLRDTKGRFCYLKSCRVGQTDGVRDFHELVDGLSDLVIWCYDSQENFERINGTVSE